MPKTRIELNLKGINELMKSEAVQEELERCGENVAATAGEGYASRVHLASWVAIANVYADTKKARRDNIKNNTLLKVVS